MLSPKFITGILLGLCFTCISASRAAGLRNANKSRLILYDLLKTPSGDSIRRTIAALPAEEPVIDISEMTVKYPSCNQKGSITGIKVRGYNNEPVTYAWTDLNLNTLPGLDITDLAPGKYTLRVTSDVTGESSIYQITLTVVSGPGLNQANVKATSTACNQNQGSITGMQPTGTAPFTYKWYNENFSQVASTLDLTGMPGGTYFLAVSDASQCPPVYSAPVTIVEVNGVTSLNLSAAKYKPASCNKDNGAITGIRVPGATKYEWTGTSGQVLSTDPDFVGHASGSYTLTVYKGACYRKSPPLVIPEAPPTIYPNYVYTITRQCSGTNKGRINIKVDNTPVKLTWRDADGKPLGYSNILDNLSEGSYYLYLTDANDCETQYGAAFKIESIPKIRVDQASGTVYNDQCSSKTGSIRNLVVTGGLAPYTFTWHNASGATVAITRVPRVDHLAAGNYSAVVTDSSGCSMVSTKTYTVSNEDNAIAAPLLKNIELCGPGEATLRVNGLQPNSVYRLYDSALGTSFIEEQASGVFNLNVKKSGSYFVSRVYGACESTRTEVKVIVALSDLTMSNAFTPNGDGINDVWAIAGIEYYSQIDVQVFNRNGQKVFQSNGYVKPFNGSYKGYNLPAGTYYYIIKVNSGCGIVKGNVAILR